MQQQYLIELRKIKKEMNVKINMQRDETLNKI